MLKPKDIKRLLFFPNPVILVSSKFKEQESIITISWVGVPNFEPAMMAISLQPRRFSYSLIKKAQEFVLNIPTAGMVDAVKYCGEHSGRTMDKWAQCNLTRGTSKTIQTPFIEECPINVECKIEQIIELGSHHLIIAEVQHIRNTMKLSKSEYPEVLTYTKGKYKVYSIHE